VDVGRVDVVALDAPPWASRAYGVEILIEATDVADVIVAFLSVIFASASQDDCADAATGTSAATSRANHIHRMT